MIVLGLGGFFHDFNAAALDLRSGALAMAEEERFSRRKHHSLIDRDSTSIDCIHYVLQQIGARLEDVGMVAFSDVEAHKVTPFLRGLFPDAQTRHVEHHLCHAAAAYYCSGHDDAAVLSLDGFGDGHSGLLAHGKDGRLDVVRYIDEDNSIGMEYLRVTYQLGLGGHGSEGKTQGLAAYGEPAFLDEYLENVRFLDDGGIELSEALRRMADWLPGEHYVASQNLFNDFLLERINRRIAPEPFEQSHLNMAASIQELLNRAALHCAGRLAHLTGSPNLALTGGVALNSTMNGVLISSGLYQDIYAHPAASDRGSALGALLHTACMELGHRQDFTMSHVYHGREFSQAEMEAALAKAGLSYETDRNPSLAAAQMIADGKIVGWFQGRSELGARALGNRSILADPRLAENKDIINAKIKHREWFRPFAPAVIESRAAEYFAADRPMPFMTFTVDVLPDKRGVIPAVTHEDGTARIQTVNREQNPAYYDIIAEFERISGVPVIINTSFNDNGEPIVDSPEDAVECLRKTDMDAVIIGNCVVDKAAQGRGADSRAA